MSEGLIWCERSSTPPYGPPQHRACPTHISAGQSCHPDVAPHTVPKAGAASRGMQLHASGGTGPAFPGLVGGAPPADPMLAGVPADFRLALVAKSATLIAVYDAAVVEAGRLGLQARRFQTEEEAKRWLLA